MQQEEKLFAVQVIILQSAKTAEEAIFNVQFCIGKIIPDTDFEVICAIQANSKPEYAFNHDSYLNLKEDVL